VSTPETTEAESSGKGPLADQAEAFGASQVAKEIAPYLN